MTFPWNRKRVSPSLAHTDINEVQSGGGPFSYHMGDVFTPGASGFAIDRPNALQLQSVFGRGGVASVVGRKFSWDFRAQQAFNYPTTTQTNAANGGVLVGTFGLTTLSSRNGVL